MHSHPKQQQPEIVVGLAHFKNDFSIQMKQHLIKEKHHIILRRNVWDLNDEQFNKNELKYLISHMKQVECIKFHLDNNFDPDIILSILQPVFTNLTYINLTNNHIQNIEALSFLNIENLQGISLTANQITTMKSMNKMKFNNMSYIDINKNKIIDLQSQRIKFNKFIYRINLQIFDKDDLFDGDISFLSKLQSQQVKKLYLRFDKYLTKEDLKKKIPPEILRQKRIYQKKVELLIIKKLKITIIGR